MDISLLIIILSVVFIVILELSKFFCFGISKCSGSYGIDIGTSMTIGGRDVQEDQLGTIETQAGTMAVLADGAGKMFGGRIASRITVETCVEIFKDYNAFNNPQYYFRKAFNCANKEILKALQGESNGSSSAGCVLIRDGYLYYALVGNVKICVYREGNLIPVSTGHTIAVLAKEKFREGKISRQDALEVLECQRLYNYLGRDGFKDIELFDAPVRLKQGDIIVLMSDGIYDLIGYRDMENIFSQRKSCQEMALEIIELVNNDTSDFKDNASLILLGVGNGANTV